MSIKVWVIIAILVGFVCNVFGEPDLYNSNITSDYSSVSWMKSTLAGTMYKLITPHPGNSGISKSFIKVRAFLSRNINLTVTVQSSSPDDEIVAYALIDSNIPGDDVPLFANITYNYMLNAYLNYTIIPDETIEWIPLWTGEAFYIESTGDLSGTTISQDHEDDKTLCEVVSGSDGIVIGQGTNLLPGFVLDSSPPVPNLWGAIFIFPMIPLAMWTGGYTAKYVTWEPWQAMRITFQNGTVKNEWYDGHGAGTVMITENQPLMIETDLIAHMSMLTWSSPTLPPSMVHIPDARSGVTVYQFDTLGYSTVVEADIWVVCIIVRQHFNQLRKRIIETGETVKLTKKQDVVVSDGDDDDNDSEEGEDGDNIEYQEIANYALKVTSIPAGLTTQIYTIANSGLLSFMVFMFAKCTEGEGQAPCAMANTMENSPVSVIDFGQFSGKPPTSNKAEIGGTPPGGLETTMPTTQPPPTTTPPTTQPPPTTVPTPAPTTEPATTAAPTSPPTTRPTTREPSTAGPTSPAETTPDIGTTVPPLPDGYLAENPFESMCPCLHVKNLALWPQFAGTYLRMVHGEGASSATMAEMAELKNPDIGNRFGVADGYVTFNGKPVWRHVACEQYIFWHSAEVKYWLVGPEIGQSKGVMLNYGRTPLPVTPDLSNPWKFGNQNNWVEDGKASTECSCQEIEYESAYFDTTVTTEPEGYYYLYGTLNDHVLYKHMNYSYYLYYYKDQTAGPVCEYDEWWGVGEYPGGAGPFAYVRDATYSMAEITAEWRVSTGDKTASDPWVTDSLASLQAIGRNLGFAVPYVHK